jgi:hypothetical protein
MLPKLGCHLTCVSLLAYHMAILGHCRALHTFQSYTNCEDIYGKTHSLLGYALSHVFLGLDTLCFFLGHDCASHIYLDIYIYRVFMLSLYLYLFLFCLSFIYHNASALFCLSFCMTYHLSASFQSFLSVHTSQHVPTW